MLFPAEALPAETQAFGFLPAQHSGGRVTAGPQPLRIERGDARHPALALPTITSALPVLLARDFAPLLTINAPETAAAGTEIAVRVTCYNPSPKPLRARVSLIVPPSWKLLEASQPGLVPAWGERTVTLRTRSGGGERSVITARLDYFLAKQGQMHLESVPVDVFANAPP